MLKKVLDSKIYRIIITIIEILFIINIGIMFCINKFNESLNMNKTLFWINILIVVAIFTFDCIINACVNKMIYCNKRKEEGFQATRYCYISLITSCAIAFPIWIIRTIPAMKYNEKGAFGFLVLILVISITVFCIFFYMIIMFLINNKIVLSNENYDPNNQVNNKLTKF